MTDSEMDYVATGKAVTENYENLLHKYHPALQNVLTATSNLNNSLFELARNQANYIKSLDELQNVARESEVNSVIPDNLATTQELYTQINNELTDFQKVIAQDLVHPFESKSAIDKTFLENELNGFRGNWNSALNDLVAKEKNLQKLQKSRGKSKKDDQKRVKLETEIAERKQQMDKYAQINYKKSLVENNRRYSYIAEKQKKHCQKLKILCEQSLDIITDNISQLDIDEHNLEKEAEITVNKMLPRKSIYETAISDSEIPPTPTSPAMNHMQPKKAVIPATNGVSSYGKKRVIASHTYAGDGKTKLELEINDIIQLLIPQPRDGWHYGENERTRQRGWFPIQYTHKVHA